MLGNLSTKKRSQGGQRRLYKDVLKASLKVYGINPGSFQEGHQRLYSVVQVVQEGMPAVWGSKDCQAKQTVSTLTCALFSTQHSELLLQNKGNNYLTQNFWWTCFLFSADPTFPSYGGWKIKYPGIRAGKFSLSLITILLAAHFLPVLCPKNIHRNHQLRRLLLNEKCKFWIYR